MPARRRIPSYRLHKPSGQAVVRLDGHDYYLGRHGSSASQSAYDRLIAEWLSRGRVQSPAGADRPGQRPTLLNEVILAYWQHAQVHYRTVDGQTTGELANVRDALRPLRKLYGLTPARDFGPLALCAVRDEMIRSGLSRTTINARVRRVRRVFRWAASVEMIPVTIYQALHTVPGLQKGRCAAPEPPGIRPVPVAHVEAVLPFLTPPVAALVRLQLLTACRPCEALSMKGCELLRGESIWEYRPGAHKNAWRGHERVILLGPQAQAVVREFLKEDPSAHLFSPGDAVESCRQRRRMTRTTKPTPSELRRRQRARPQLKLCPSYSRRSYYRAIVRACQRAGVPEWCPLQLRHTAATQIRQRFGLEAAQIILGHSRVETSQLYAERDLARAATIVAEVG